MKAKIILFLTIIVIALSSCYSQRELTPSEQSEYDMHIYRMKRYLCDEPGVDFDIDDFIDEYRKAKKIKNSRVLDSLYSELCDAVMIEF